MSKPSNYQLAQYKKWNNARGVVPGSWWDPRDREDWQVDGNKVYEAIVEQYDRTVKGHAFFDIEFVGKVKPSDTFTSMRFDAVQRYFEQYVEESDDDEDEEEDDDDDPSLMQSKSSTRQKKNAVSDAKRKDVVSSEEDSEEDSDEGYDEEDDEEENWSPSNKENKHAVGKSKQTNQKGSKGKRSNKKQPKPKGKQRAASAKKRKSSGSVAQCSTPKRKKLVVYPHVNRQRTFSPEARQDFYNNLLENSDMDALQCAAYLDEIDADGLPERDSKRELSPDVETEPEGWRDEIHWKRVPDDQITAEEIPNDVPGKWRNLPPNIGVLSPMEILFLFVPESIWQMCADSTNARYRLRNPHTSPGSRRTWKDVTVADIIIWHSLVVTMTLIKLPRYRLYWTKDTKGAFRGPAFGKFMSCNRWEEIKQYLGFVVSPDNDADSLARLRPVIEMLNLRNWHFMEPGSNVSADEAMVGGKLRCFLIKTVHGKPTPNGFRIWCLCDSKTGYLHRFYINDNTEQCKYPWATHGEAVILHLSEGLPIGTYLYCDRLFTTVRLAKYLMQKRNVYLVGTVKRNSRGFPNTAESKNCTVPEGHNGLYQSKSTNLDKRGTIQMLVTADGQLQASSWRDTGVVNMVAAHLPLAFRTSVSRRLPKGTISVPCHLAVMLYNLHMGGVDNFDHMRQGIFLLFWEIVYH
jgi:hypothetical protein